MANPSRNTAALAVLGVIFGSGPVKSESLSGDALLKAESLSDQASSLENSGDYSRAEKLCREALTIREN